MIRGTLDHIVKAEAFYISPLTGERPQPPFYWEDGLSLGELAEYTDRVVEALIETAKRLGVPIRSRMNGRGL